MSETHDFSRLTRALIFVILKLYENIKKGDIVPVLMNRSTDLIVSMLAIVKCGAIYLPISIEYPTERIEYILENCNAKFFITTKTNNLIKIY